MLVNRLPCTYYSLAENRWGPGIGPWWSQQGAQACQVVSLEGINKGTGGTEAGNPGPALPGGP